MAGNRKSKWQRAKNPQRLILQERDKDIMMSVYEYRFLTREQIQRLFDFNCVSKANLRLRRLYDHNYLSRTFIPTSRGSLKAIYFLGGKGLNIITEKLGLDPLEVKNNQKKVSQLKSLFLRHNLNLNEVKISFSKAIERYHSINLELWVNDHDCLQEYYLSHAGQKVKRIFRPDGYFRLSCKDKLYSFFVELDQSTESHKKFKKKVESYLEFAGRGYYQKIFGVRYFRCLIIAPSIKRLTNLKKTVEEVTDKVFWFTTLERVVSEDVFSPIWQRAGHNNLHSLIEA